ncbi:MAG: sigma-70 family RNA polymerase sigma factor [Bryobacteraceae bacterium]
MQSLYERSNAASFNLTLSDFCSIILEVIGRCLPNPHSERERAQFLENLRLDDLVLARACARGHDKAWDRFLMLYRDKLYSAAITIAKDEAMARELADSIYADLFGTRTRDDGQRISKLELYLGRGSLERWLKTVLVQEYINRFRVRRKLVPFEESTGTYGNPNPPAFSVAERTRLAEATDTALAELSAEQRFLLAAHYLDGCTLAAIARILNVHESTIQRRLEKTVLKLRERIVAKLRRAGLSKRAAEEMLELDVRDLRVDVRGRLVQERRV